jgi:hypothetical protein
MEVIYSLVGLLIVMAVIPAYIAKLKGHSFGLFLFYGLMLGPIAIIHALLMKGETGTTQSGQGSKKCPYCAERIQEEAIVCKHCGRDLSPLQASTTGPNIGAIRAYRTRKQWHNSIFPAEFSGRPLLRRVLPRDADRVRFDQMRGRRTIPLARSQVAEECRFRELFRNEHLSHTVTASALPGLGPFLWPSGSSPEACGFR